MAEYVCKVGDATGRVLQHLETAQSAEEARQKLADRGFYVFSVHTHFDILTRFSRAHSDRKVRPNDFLVFNQQFNTLVKAGLPILKALDLLAERAAAMSLRPILAEVRRRVREGALLSEALAAQGAFPPVYIAAVTAGERSGNLSGVLEQYIEYLQVSTGFRSQLITTLIYPAVLTVTALSVVTYVVTFAMPRFAALYKDLGIPLPVPTTILLSIALPLRNYFLIILAIAALAAIGVFVWTRSDRGALAIDRLKPRIPIFGDIWVKAQIAQFVRTLSTLLSGGTPLVPALHTSSAAIDSRLLSVSIEQATARVREGQALHLSLAETHLVPALALEMIEVGEASGVSLPCSRASRNFMRKRSACGCSGRWQ